MNPVLRGWLGVSIGRKLGFVLLLLVTLLLLTGVIGLTALKTLNEQIAATAARRVTASSLVDRMLEEVQQLAEHARRAAAAESPERRDRALADLAAAQGRLGNVVDRISSELKDVPEVRKAIEQDFSSFVISVVKAGRLLRAGRVAEAQRELSVEFEPKLLAYVLTTVTAMEQHARTESLHMEEASQRSRRQSQKMLALVIGFAILAAVSGQVLLNRTVVRPVRRAVQAAESLANGRFDIDLTIPALDECGEMLRAMERLKDRLQTVAQVQRGLLQWDGRDAAAPQRQGAAPLPGVHGELIEAVSAAMHRSRASYHAMRSELLAVTTAIGQGDFSRKLEAPDMEGMWRELAQMLNQLTDRLAAALDDVSRQLAELSRGNLRHSAHRHHEGLLGAVVEGMAGSIAELSTIVTVIRASADSVAAEAGHIAERNLTLAAQTERQAGALEESATAVERLAGMARETARNAADTHGLMQTASQAAKRGSELTGHVIDTMESIQSVSQRITAMVGIINSVAFQTNILALNAAIEAARAGEQGRGFAVVADEVRSLAGRTAAAAREIEGLVLDTKGKVDAGMVWVGQAGESMQTIVHDVGAAAAMIGEISRANQTQSRDIDQVNGTIGQLRDTTGQNARMVEDAVAAVRKLADEAANLLQSVAVFKLSSGAAAGPNAPPSEQSDRNDASRAASGSGGFG